MSGLVVKGSFDAELPLYDNYMLGFIHVGITLEPHKCSDDACMTSSSVIPSEKGGVAFWAELPDYDQGTGPSESVVLVRVEDEYGLMVRDAVLFQGIDKVHARELYEVLPVAADQILYNDVDVSDMGAMEIVARFAL